MFYAQLSARGCSWHLVVSIVEEDGVWRERMMEGLKIWLLTVIAAIAYGVAHDQVTARVSLEYFTVGHAGYIGTESATLLAIFWGVVATWWVGALLGLVLVLAARIGGRPKLSVADLIRPGWVLILCVALLAVAAGVIGYIGARAGLLSLSGFVAAEVPATGHARFIADLWAHNASYVGGFVGGIALAAWIWNKRARRARRHPAAQPVPAPPSAA